MFVRLMNCWFAGRDRGSEGRAWRNQAEAETALPHIPDADHDRQIIRAIADKFRAGNGGRPEPGIRQNLEDAKIVAPPICAPEPAFGMLDLAQGAVDLDATREHSLADKISSARNIVGHLRERRIFARRRVAIPRRLRSERARPTS